MKKNMYSLLKGLLCLFLLIIFNTLKAQVQTAKNISMCSNSNGYYEYLPQGYSSGTQTYPLILFIHGVGELGNGTTQLSSVLNGGLPNAIKSGRFPTSFSVNGQSFSFIVLSPQFIGWPSPTDIENVLNYAVKNYRVNTSRIYLTGLSMGGGVTWDYAGGSSTYANRLAAIVPIAGASWPDYNRSRVIASANLPVWAFHNSGDGTVSVSNTDNYVAQINQAPAPNPPAKKTIFQSSSHDAWTQVYNSTYTENGMNAFQWMLQYSRNGASPSNLPPIANGGGNKTITLPTSSIILNGSGSDPDGSISSYAWTQINGVTASISNPSSATTTISGLTSAGTRTFRLTVTDNKGAKASNDVNVIVNAANQAPVVTVGNSISIILPVSSATLSGSATDPDGSISKYLWTQVTGATAVIASPDKATTNITGLTTSGTRVFRLTVTDNAGATASKDVSVVVNNQGTTTPTTTKKINVNVYGTAAYNNAEWNNWNTYTGGLTSPSFKYSDGSSSSITAVLSAQSSYSDNGPNYAVTTFPQQVGRDASWHNTTRTLTIKGLDNSKRYDLGLLASRVTAGQNTRFTINGISKDIATSNNFTNLAIFNDIVPSSAAITVTISQTGYYNYLNGFTITEKTGTNSALTATAQKMVSVETVSVFPNPIQDKFVLTVNNSFTGRLAIEIKDLNGNSKKRYTVNKPTAGSMQNYLSVSSIPSGQYIITAIMESWTESIKIIKQ